MMDVSEKLTTIKKCKPVYGFLIKIDYDKWIKPQLSTMASCTAVKKNGVPCSFKAKFGEFCGFHAPKTRPSDEAPLPGERDCGECPICYDTVNSTAARVLDCNHTFHKTCVDRWLRTCNTCPMCRTPVDRQVMDAPRHRAIDPRRAIARRRAVRGVTDDNVRVARAWSRGELTTLLNATSDLREVTAAVQRLLAILS